MKIKAGLLAMICFVAITAGIWRSDYSLRVEQHAKEVARTEENVARAVDIVANRIDAVLNLLADSGNVVAQSFINSGSAVSAFDRFVVDGDLLRRHPEMDAIAFMRLVDTADAGGLAEVMNADPARMRSGHGRISPRPDTELPTRVMVELIHPLSFSERMSGFDLMMTPRRGTLERALSFGKPAASGKISLFGDRPGVVVYSPVYLAPDDALPHGFMATGFVTDVFINNLSALLQPLNVDIAIYDAGTAQDANLPFNDESRLATLILSDPDLNLGSILADDRTIRSEISFADHRWVIVARPANAVLPPAWVPDKNVLLGSLIALLIGRLVFLTRRDAGYLAKQVALKTNDLQSALSEIENRRAEAQYQSLHDDLTGLLNKRGLRLALEDMLTSSAIRLLSIDLDGFKGVNDTRGHVVGDAVLVAVAEKLNSLATDGVLLSRPAGDEFIVAIKSDKHAESCSLTQQFMDWVKEPITVEGQQVHIGASMGISDSHVSGTHLPTLLADADVALYRSKQEGRNRQTLCTPALREEHDAGLKLGDQLRYALDADEIEPYFQTQHDATTHEIVGAEALMRWIHPERGMVSPAEFLPVAEALGIMRDIDERMLEKSVSYMRQLEHLGHPLPKLSVNVSFARLSDPALFECAQSMPQTATKLVFEIVEAVFLDDRKSIESWKLDQLKELGVGIELDDFGTGHASVVALTELRPDRLKLDRSFTFRLPDPSYEGLVRSIVDMGLSLGIPSTAEGVETAEQAEILRNIGIDTFQGFHFSHPVAFSQLRDNLQMKAA